MAKRHLSQGKYFNSVTQTKLKLNLIKHFFFFIPFQSMITLKERKEMEDSFKKAQKPWAKLLQKVEKAKSEYHNSCKTERTAANMERNASADSSLSPDQVLMRHF